MTGPDAAADRQGDGPALLRHRLGAELRRLREERSLRLEDVCARLGVAPSTLSRIETGKAPTRTVYLNTLLDLYRVDDPEQRRALAGLAREGQRKGWWTDYKDVLPAGLGNYLGLEASATQVYSYSAQVVPGLLQVKRYAAAACRAAHPGLNANQVSALVTVQTRRREHLRTGCQLHLVIEEAALLHRIGSSNAEKGWLLAQLEQWPAKLPVPPPYSKVWLACWDCMAPSAVSRGSVLNYAPSAAPLPTTDGSEVVGQFTTLAVGFAVFQVFTVDFVAAEVRNAKGWNPDPPDSIAPAIPLIWPHRLYAGDIEWPPPLIPNSSFDRLANWDMALRRGAA